MPDFDVLAIGGGAAGLTIAVGGTLIGFKAALVERHRVGGECTWTGCVPSKAILHTADVAAAARVAAAWSVDGAPPPPQLDFAKVRAHVHGARDQIARTETPEHLRGEGIAVLQGSARLVAPGVVEVDGRSVTARHIVICSGSYPAVPDVPGLAETRTFTNETIFDDLESLPARLAVVGGGPIGCELAQAFARLGSRVTLIQSRDRLLPREEPAVSPILRAALERDGVTVLTDARLMRATPAADGGRGATLSLEGRADVAADAVLIATGRRARVQGFGLEEAGVTLGHDGIQVDDHLQTSVPGVWAIGDCVGPYRFTHVAEMHGRVVLRNILFPWRKQKVDYSAIPWCTFTDPEVGRVGLTEDEARRRYGSSVHSTTLPMSRIDRAVAEGATDGFIKLVARKRKLLGAHVVGPAAGELTQQAALVMSRGLPVSALSMVTVYPAISYGLHQAADRLAGQHFKRNALLQGAAGVIRRLALR